MNTETKIPTALKLETDYAKVRKKIIDRCRSAEACTREYKKLAKTETEYDFWLVIFSNLSWCKDTGVTEGIKLPEKFSFPKIHVGDIDLSGCDITGIELPENIVKEPGAEMSQGSLHLSGCNVVGMNLPKRIDGHLYLCECNLSGVKFPDYIGLDLYVEGSNYSVVKLPKYIKDKIFNFT